MIESRVWRRLAAVSACLVLAVTAAACSSTSSSTANKTTSSTSTSSTSSTNTTKATTQPFNVLDITETTGALTTIAEAQKAGLEAAAAYLNAHTGGILGHKIVITAVNDNGKTTTAVSELDSYLSSHSKPPNDVDDGEEGTIAAALLPVLATHHILSLGVSDAANICATVTKCPEQFVPETAAATQLKAVGVYVKTKGYTNVGILQIDTSFSANETPTMSKILQTAGAKTEVKTFKLTATTVTSEMSALKAAGAKAIVAEVIGAPVGYVIKARKAIGWTVPIIGDPAFASTAVASLVPAATLKTVYAVVFPDTEYGNPKMPPGVKTLITQLHKTGVKITQPLNLYSLLWDGLIQISIAAKQANSITQGKIVTALENMKSSASPLYATYVNEKYSTSSHENVAANATTYPVAPEGPIVTGQVKAAS